MEDSVTLNRRHFLAASGLMGTAAVVSACGGGSSDASKASSVTTAAGPATTKAGPTTTGGAVGGSGELTLYNAQHEDLMKLFVEAFTKATGVKVNVRKGKDFELGNQIIKEADKSPADIFVTENSPAMQAVAEKGLLGVIDPKILGQVPKDFSQAKGEWMAMAARATVFVHHKDKLPAAKLPASIMDLSKPEWKGRIGCAPAGADFQAIVSAVLALKGKPATEAWLKGLKTNAKPYQSNGATMKAVNAGEIEGGVIYHYYWYKDQAEAKANSGNTLLHYFKKQDPGAFVSLSGAGYLKSSKNAAGAQKFLEFMTGPEGQKVLSNSKALEYTVNPNVSSAPALPPLKSLEYPKVDPSKLNGPEVVKMMQDVGFI